MTIITMGSGGALYAGASCIGFLHRNGGEIKFHCRDGYALSAQVMLEVCAYIDLYQEGE